MLTNEKTDYELDCIDALFSEEELHGYELHKKFHHGDSLVVCDAIRREGKDLQWLQVCEADEANSLNCLLGEAGSGVGLQSVVSAARAADGVQPQVHVLAIVFVTSASVAKLRIIRQRLAHKVAFRVYLNRQDAKGRRIFRLLTEEECTQAASCV